MVKWIVFGVVLVALVVLAVAVRRAVGALPRLDRAARNLRRREAQVEVLRRGAEGIEVQLAGFREQAETAQRRMIAIKAGRGE